MFTNRCGIIALSFALLLTIQGCDKKDEPRQAPAPVVPAPQTAPAPPAPVQPPPPAVAPASQATAPAAPAAPAAPTPEVAPPSQAAAPAPAAPPAPQAAPAKPLAGADGEGPGSRIEVQELKRVSGGTMMLRFAMINDADQALSFGYSFGSGSTGDYGTVAGVHLIDAVGKKKYLVVRDTESKCDCSRGVRDIPAKSRVNLWARFPAPPDSVEKITVVVPKFSPMDDVSISR